MIELEKIRTDILRELSDEQLLSLMDRLAANERSAVVDVLTCLAEIDRRSLAGKRGCSDMFDYCVRRLRMSRGAAYRRINAARAAARHSEIYGYVREGEISLCVLSKVASDLGFDAIEAIRACRGKSVREAEVWLASRKPPEEAVPDKIIVRPPISRPGDPPFDDSAQSSTLITSDKADSKPGSPETTPAKAAYEYTFTATAELHDAIERLKDILYRKVPFRNLDGVLKIAVAEYLERNDRAVAREVSRPVKPGAEANRYVPSSIRNSIWARDGGRCVFVFEGARCQARRGLEVDHVIPFSAGGRSDDPKNLRLLCREHNQLERRQRLGEGEPGR